MRNYFWNIFTYISDIMYETPLLIVGIFHRGMPYVASLLSWAFNFCYVEYSPNPRPKKKLKTWFLPLIENKIQYFRDIWYYPLRKRIVGELLEGLLQFSYNSTIANTLLIDLVEIRISDKRNESYKSTLIWICLG